MGNWQATFLGLKQLPRVLTAFEIEAFFTFTLAERQLIEDNPAISCLVVRPGFGRHTRIGGPQRKRALSGTHSVPPTHSRDIVLSGPALLVFTTTRHRKPPIGQRPHNTRVTVSQSGTPSCRNGRCRGGSYRRYRPEPAGDDPELTSSLLPFDVVVLSTPHAIVSRTAI
jgi:hypothetical protein